MLIMKLRRLAAMLIAAAMMVTFMPAMAFADDVPNVEKTTIRKISVEVTLPKCGDNAENRPDVTLVSEPEGIVAGSDCSWVQRGESGSETPVQGFFSGNSEYWLKISLSYDTSKYEISYPYTTTLNGKLLRIIDDYFISKSGDEEYLYIRFTPEHKWGEWTIGDDGASHSCSAQGCGKSETFKKYVIIDTGANHGSLSEKARNEFGGIKGGKSNQFICTWDSIGVSGTVAYIDISINLQMVLASKGFLDMGQNPYRYFPYQYGDNSEALIGFAPKQSYDSEDSFNNDLENEASDASVVYALWAVEAKKGAFTVTPLTCGEEVSIETGEGLPIQKPKPVVNADPTSEFDFIDEEEYYNTFTYWLKSNPQESLVYEFLEGKIEGGREYTASFMIRPKFGFYCSADAGMQDESPAPVAPLDPGTLGTFAYDSDHGFPIRQLIPLNAAIEVNGKPEKAFIAWGLGEVPFVFANIAADHDWGPWTVTKEPTTSEDGEETRTCKICGAKETRAVPKPSVKQKKLLMATVRTKGRKSVRLTWNAMTDADGYDIFFARCNYGKKIFTCKYAGSVKSGKSTSWSKGGLKKGTPYKMYVKAYVKKGGKKKYIAKSPTVHAFTGGASEKYTNPKRVKVKKASVAIKTGKTYKIKASVIKLKKNRKLINTDHAPKLRYLSTNTSVATVSKSGKVKGKAAGSCRIYVLAANGVKKSVKVTVR